MDASWVEYPSIDVRIAHDFMEELNEQQREFVYYLCTERRIHHPLPEQGETKFFLTSYDYACKLPPFLEVSALVSELYGMDFKRFQKQYGYWN